MSWVEQYSRRAAEQGAEIVCFPESYVPGMRAEQFTVPPHCAEVLREARDRACKLAAQFGVAIVLPMDWDDPRGILNLAFVISAQGDVVGCQTKNQLDPSEDEIFVAGDERMLFELEGLTFGIAICHEGFRYPESVRWAATRGATLVFHPQCTGSDHEGTRLVQWGAKENPYYEKAMLCRAVENEIFIAGINYSFDFQESASCVIAPSGKCLAYQPYGVPGVLIVDIEPARATRGLAMRYGDHLYR